MYTAKNYHEVLFPTIKSFYEIFKNTDGDYRKIYEVRKFLISSKCGSNFKIIIYFNNPSFTQDFKKCFSMIRYWREKYTFYDQIETRIEIFFLQEREKYFDFPPINGENKHKRYYAAKKLFTFLEKRDIDPLDLIMEINKRVIEFL